MQMHRTRKENFQKKLRPYTPYTHDRIRGRIQDNMPGAPFPEPFCPPPHQVLYVTP